MYKSVFVCCSYQTMIRGFTLLQSHVRRIAAKKQLKQLRLEARDLHKVREKSKGLEVKIIELQQKLDQRAKEMAVLREERVKFNDLKNEFSKLQVRSRRPVDTITRAPGISSCFQGVKAEGERSRDTIVQLEETIRLLRVELDKERDEKEKMKYERDVIKTQSKEVS